MGPRTQLRVLFRSTVPSPGPSLPGSAAGERTAATQACQGMQGQVPGRSSSILCSPGCSPPRLHTRRGLRRRRFSAEKGKAAGVAPFWQLSAAACASGPLLAATAPPHASDKPSCFLPGVFSIRCSACVAKGRTERRAVRVTVPATPQGNTVCTNQSGCSLV